MKRILYIGGFELPDKNAAAQRVLSNGKALRDLGHEIIFVGLTKSVPRRFNFEGFDCHEIIYPQSKRAWVSFLFSIRKESELINQFNPDVLIFYNYPSFKLGRLKSRFKGKIVFGDITEWYEAPGVSLVSIIKRIDVWFRMKIILPQIDGLIVISDYLENFYKGKVKKLINIPPLVDVYEDKWKKNSNPLNDRYNLVYAGSPGAGNKDRLDLVISSINKARLDLKKDIHINIIGLSKQQFLENFGTTLNDNIDDTYIHFNGRVSHSKALEFIKEADFSIFFRDSNLTNTAGFPTKFVESISCGTPVITNASSNLHTYFEKYPMIGYVFKSLTDEELILGIKLALSSSKEDILLKKEFCLNSRLFDYRKYTDKFYELF
ncbi:hypothetical protein AAW12_11615 [Sphingobacterium sp. Ag1]|uniref:glycosyltransferase n=1 Tax=Sphingobacterium sp. Ag1 TaxID=1643451 RepID=UPI00062804F3|nr:glycosyltransferase [Sphingobacterium sp. Ag1]KKO91171.1 hypothetical protein AAW12_11615 [Sphingobacterium sp. Ag1]